MAGAFGVHALAPSSGNKAATWGMANQYAILNGIGLQATWQYPI
ncbi:hypothetical protein BMF94_3270 [Rhodotorula taiwanensis]|uniref:Uncharacterized protein n=1 Tax=Rhodotorula taiwanensis TaxID=741276 RepID=A0A2S5BAD2_9BASI|nr:hypothetical protein BMF94_3270 [Rhodotorula taiwanensis]